jgi:hypothetical protein
MLRLLGWLIKLGVFATIVLVLGHVVTWKGKTISDQVKTQLSHAERTDLVGKVKRWSKEIDSTPLNLGTGSGGTAPKTGAGKDTAEELLSSERQKLKALIQELNSSH